MRMGYLRTNNIWYMDFEWKSKARLLSIQFLCLIKIVFDSTSGHFDYHLKFQFFRKITSEFICSIFK